VGVLVVPAVVLGLFALMVHERSVERWWDDKPDKAWRLGRGPEGKP
jgi:hypothetical protein